MMCLSMKKQLIKAAYIRQLFPRERHPMYFVGTRVPTGFSDYA